MCAQSRSLLIKGVNPAPQDTATARKASNFTVREKRTTSLALANFTAKPRWGPRRIDKLFGVLRQGPSLKASASIHAPMAQFTRASEYRCAYAAPPLQDGGEGLQMRGTTSLARMSVLLVRDFVKAKSRNKADAPLYAVLHEKRDAEPCVLFFVDCAFTYYALT